MARIILSYFLPLALPTVFYFAWTMWVRKQVTANRARARAAGAQNEHGDHTEVADFDIATPWFRLILAGVVLMMVSLVLSVFIGGKNPQGSVYQAPRMQGDTIIPGQFVAPSQPRPSP